MQGCIVVTLDKRIPLQAERERHRLKHKGDLTHQFKGDVVIIKSEEKNRAQWKLGIIDDLITGSDGLIRGVKLKSRKSRLERPIQHLYPELSCDGLVQTPPEVLDADTPTTKGCHGGSQITHPRYKRE